ncbi:hypothetical protein [Methylobacterium oxalidis]|uniref:DUF2946 domain-containing protein n=1 Tax=Methylobacterium oxalidis TaxID=944322 RepID=A0A512IZZ1_9HYPH|nr:hypothetical protein [Methylobacterium oxalidis]GEP03280.1 hypothetical protein MOX02_13180 [Methylobacterium oxalidis]GJE30375.1 hypothetical protein LDDCCGHA_0542 [Methylobacterium oxalidis]GLS64214.1 hypothetical protein GCM10007888_25950 [Methylobacterium oxalidis]
MRGSLPLPVHGRAVIAVIALYALLIQAFLGGLAPIALGPSGGEICAHDGTPGDDGAACHQHACCTLAQAVQLLAPHLSVFAVVLWEQGAAAPAPWRAAETVRARAPPDQSVSPRGPPTP